MQPRLAGFATILFAAWRGWNVLLPVQRHTAGTGQRCRPSLRCATGCLLLLCGRSCLLRAFPIAIYLLEPFRLQPAAIFALAYACGVNMKNLRTTERVALVRRWRTCARALRRPCPRLLLRCASRASLLLRHTTYYMQIPGAPCFLLLPRAGQAGAHGPSWHSGRALFYRLLVSCLPCHICFSLILHPSLKRWQHAFLLPPLLLAWLYSRCTEGWDLLYDYGHSRVNSISGRSV